MRTDSISAKAVWCISAICGGAAMLPLGATGIRAESVEPALTLEAKIPLGDVSGRIDHMAIDPKRQRLFVAELGNNTVGVVDLKERKVVHVIAGLKEPQGVAYVPSSDMIYVANAGDGSVRIFRADNFEPAGQYRSRRGRRQHSGGRGPQSSFCRIREWRSRRDRPGDRQQDLNHSSEGSSRKLPTRPLVHADFRQRPAKAGDCRGGSQYRQSKPQAGLSKAAAIFRWRSTMTAST